MQEIYWERAGADRKRLRLQCRSDTLEGEKEGRKTGEQEPQPQEEPNLVKPMGNPEPESPIGGVCIVL